MDARRKLGRAGEDIAADLLQDKGFTILARNWRCALGELDLVVRRGSTVAAVEVKTRRSLAFGSPAAAVTPRKAGRLRLLMGRWLAEHPQHCDIVRIDVVSVLCPVGGPAEVTHLEAVA